MEIKETYILGLMDVKDHKDYLQRYGVPFVPILKKYQGELLAATKNARTLEGEDFGNWTVLLKFPSKDLAYAFVTSKEYEPLMKLRVHELTNGGRAILFPAEVPE